MKIVDRRFTLRLHERLTGRHILARLDELNRTQWLSRDELETLQNRKLLRVAEYAYRYVPYYRRTFDAAGFHPADLEKDPAALARLPILTKAIIRKNWDDLLTSEPQRRKQLSLLSTSGSTGEPLTFMQDSDFRDAVTADIQRHIGWGGWKLGDPQAFIWGAKLNPTARQRLRAGLIDWIWNRFLTDAFALSDEKLAAFAEKAIRRNPRILFGYPTAIQVFARFARDRGLKQLTFDAVFTTAERLLPTVRQEIAEIFRAQVFNRYSSLDLGCVACECEAHTGLHLSMENNYVEILAGGRPAPAGQSGEVIVTNLNNLGMPFIRYQVGDVAQMSAATGCPCGRQAPMLAAVEGRSVEALRAMDGRYVWGGFAGAPWRCLADPAIRQFQVVQKSVDEMLFRIVPAGEIGSETLDGIRQAVSSTFGEGVRVAFEFPAEIAPLPSGKHSYVVSYC